MTIPGNWTPDVMPVDYFLLEGDPSPGFAEVTADSKRNLQIMSGRGWNDSRVRFVGFDTQEFDIILHLQGDDDWFAWHKWKKHVAKRLDNDAVNTQVAKALPIWHPFLADPTIAIKSVIVKNVSTPKKVGDEGFWDITITFVSFRKPKVSYAAYDGAKAEDTDTPNGKIIRKNSQTIDDLVGQNLPPPP